MAFKDTLRRLMDEQGMKATTLSKLSGISEGLISEYLSGKKEPLGKTSIAIAKALGVSLDVLWDYDSEDEKISSENENASNQSNHEKDFDPESVRFAAFGELNDENMDIIIKMAKVLHDQQRVARQIENDSKK